MSVVPVDVPVVINGLSYKRGCHDFVYVEHDGRWVRSSFELADLANAMRAENLQRKKQGLGVKYEV